MPPWLDLFQDILLTLMLWLMEHNPVFVSRYVFGCVGKTTDFFVKLILYSAILLKLLIVLEAFWWNFWDLMYNKYIVCK